MEKKIEIEITPEEKMTIFVAEPECPTLKLVLLCHGLMSDKESSTNRELTRRLLSENIATCRFDFYGHGEDSHPFQAMTLTRCLKQTEGVLDWILKNNFTQIGLMGSSFGGLVAIHAAARRKEVRRLALKCPVSNYPPLWSDRLGKAGMAVWKESDLLTFAGLDGRRCLEYAFYEDLLKYDTIKEAEDITIPTLIVHGDADEDVPCSQSEKLFETLRADKAFELIQGADHPFSKDEDFEQMVDRIEAWFVKS